MQFPDFDKFFSMTERLYGRLSAYTSTFRLIDRTDETKRVRFDASGLTTNTERTLTVPDLDGTLAVQGAAAGETVFNEAGADVNFRVESDGNANMLFVDGGNNRVGIGTGTPGSDLYVTAAGGVVSSIVETSTGNAELKIYDTTDGGWVIFPADGTLHIANINTAGVWQGNVLSLTQAGVLTAAAAIAISTAGTATQAPLKLTAGTNLTTPEAGAVEYDGNVLYFDPTASHRTLLPGHQMARVDAATALVGDTSAQAMFAAANDTLTVIAGATYRFRCVARLTTGATSSSVSFLFGGTATFTTVNYVSHGIHAASGTAAASSMNNGEADTAVIVVPDGTGVNKRFMIEGEFEVNGAGTLIPQVQFSADPEGDETVNVGSFFECWRIGANPVTSIGLWA